MKLEVGMYVRLNNSAYNTVVINRIANIYEHTILTENDGSMYEGEYSKEEIIGEPSFDIIDVVQVGDYVNGEKVTFIQSCREIISTDKNIRITNEDIKSIVTKEQFSQMEYKVGE